MACTVPRNRLAKRWTFHRPDPQAHSANSTQTNPSSTVDLWSRALASSLGMPAVPPRICPIPVRPLTGESGSQLAAIGESPDPLPEVEHAHVRSTRHRPGLPHAGPPLLLRHLPHFPLALTNPARTPHRGRNRHV